MTIEITNLSKKYGSFTAVEDVSFNIKAGEFVGILGPNGAGKTTTLHMLLGLITPSAGDIRFFGKPLQEHRSEILDQVNFTAPYAPLPYRLSVEENLRVFAGIYRVERPA